MSKIPGINHIKAIKALCKIGFQIVCQGKHTIMPDGKRIITIPRNNPINAYTMGGIVKDAGISVKKFKELL